jgi:catechol 2,3-dioxygenase-like lactoylglutathione lyase family enzyme
MMNSISAFRPHISLDVKNVEKSVAFYQAFFGIAPSKERPGYAKFELSTPPLNFTMKEREVASRGGLSHLGFEVASTDEVLETQLRLKKAGLSTFEELETTCCYAKQDKVWVNDPDGNPWEVFVVTEKDTVEHSKPNLKRPSELACCAPVEGQVTVACC